MVISQSFSLSFLIQWWELNTSYDWAPPASDCGKEGITACTITNWLSILYSFSHSFLFIVSLFLTRNNYNKYIYFFPHSYLVYSLMTSLFFIIVTFIFLFCVRVEGMHTPRRTLEVRGQPVEISYISFHPGITPKFSSLAASTLNCWPSHQPTSLLSVFLVFIVP